LIKAKKTKALNFLVLEVGLGGRLDAVNHFDADCTCITSISRDHQSILGNRYSEILLEKIAVSREKKPLFTNFNLEYLNNLTAEYVQKKKIDWRIVRTKQAGENYFLENQQMAWEIFQYLCPSSKAVFGDSILSLPLYKGRREIMTFSGKSLIFIGAHNIDGVRRMLQSYQHSSLTLSPETLLVSFSQRPVKEVEIMLKSLLGYFGNEAKLFITCFDHPKALDKDIIKDVCLKVNKEMLNFTIDWKTEIKNSKSQTILVCGSYYFIGEVQRFINS
jgi:dihydrofolate synthase/folylpolyglutamate synthase